MKFKGGLILKNLHLFHDDSSGRRSPNYRSYNIKRLKMDVKLDKLRFKKMYRNDKMHTLFNSLVRKDLMNLLKRGINCDMVDNYFYQLDTLIEHVDLKSDTYKLLIYRRFLKNTSVLLQDIYSIRFGKQISFDNRHDNLYYELQLLDQMIDRNIDLL